MLIAPEPVLTADLFQPDRDALIELLRGLSEDDWARPTVCAGWSVKDVALHVLGGDLANLSRRRDRHAAIGPAPGEPLVAFLGRFNEDWVAAGRRLSPAVLIDLLAHVGTPLFDYFASLDQMAIGAPVSWAGPEPAPIWLDMAREYTERWVHQQHVRDAVGRPGQRDPRFLAPVLATFAHCLPHAYRDTVGLNGATIGIRIDGPSGGTWSIVRGGGRWRLRRGHAPSAPASVRMDEDTAWRLLTRGLTADQARRIVELDGDQTLAARVLDAVAIIA